MRNLQNLIHTPSQRLAKQVERWRKHFGQLLLGGNYRVTPAGVIVGDAVCLAGQYFTRIRERETDFVVHPNRIVSQGVLKILGISLYSDVKIPKFYLGLCSGLAPVTDALTATNFAATLNEITSMTEGYTAATRPEWTPSAPAAGVISSNANKATVTIATSASVSIAAAGLLSSNGRGATDGFLISATNFANPRELFDGETFDIGYQVSLTD